MYNMAMRRGRRGGFDGRGGFGEERGGWVGRRGVEGWVDVEGRGEGVKGER